MSNVNIPTAVVYMTATGYKRARAALAQKHDEYEQICSDRKLAHDLAGDGWHDNPDFNRLQQLEAEKTRDIARLQGLLDRAKVVEIDRRNRPVDAVRIGSKVQLTRERPAPSTTFVWEIVGWDETDRQRGLLAYNSPLGRELIGKEEGEFIDVNTPEGVSTFYIDRLFQGEITKEEGRP